VGTLFSYNLGLTSHLAAYKDIKITIGTRHLLLYVFGIGYTRHIKDLKIRLITFPTFVPLVQTRAYGTGVAKIIVNLSLFEKFMSKFDLLHLNDREYPYTKAAIKLKKPTVMTLHWPPSKIDEEVCTKVNALVSPSEASAKAVEENLGFRPTVIHHGVDDSIFNMQLSKNEAKKHLGLTRGSKIVFWNGRLDFTKDPMALVDSIPAVAKEFPDVLFVIKTRTSRPELAHAIKEKVKTTGVEKNVKLIFGWDFITEMPYYYRSADVFVHTSLSEVCGLVPIEAMACGIPIIITDLPGVKGPVGDAGLFFEPKNSEDLGMKIVKLLSDEKLRIALRDKGLRRINELGLTWKYAAKQYRDLYLSLM
jgi:glycosyltransferase involved in cell wall biosynthesis